MANLESVIDCAVFSLICLSIIQGTQPQTTIKQDYDDDYNEADYESSNDTYDDTGEDVSVPMPKFVSAPMKIWVNAGSNIKLPCLVDDFDSRMTWIWKKGSDILALGNKPYEVGDNRIKVEPRKTGNRLVILMADAEDAGEYICQVTAKTVLELKHTVNIRVPPKVEAAPGGLVRVQSGSPASLRCLVIQGTPTPTVTWRRRDRPMFTGENKKTGLVLHFPSTTRHHSGIYICQANNGGGQPSSAEVRLDVQHKPEVETDQVFVYNRDGDELDITCTVHASPPAKVEWFRNGVLLTDEERVIKMERRGNRHTLLLPSLGATQDRSGTYKCKATNKLGETEAEVEVSSHAAPVSFLSADVGELTDRYMLAWVTDSPSPVTEFLAEYKPEEGEQSWSSMTVAAVTLSSESYSGSVELTDLNPHTRYMARVASRTAEHELGSYSGVFVFSTKEKEIEKPIEEPEVNPNARSNVDESSVEDGVDESKASQIKDASEVKITEDGPITDNESNNEEVDQPIHQKSVKVKGRGSPSVCLNSLLVFFAFLAVQFIY